MIETGDALFGDRRYGQMFVYPNGAQSCYAVRGFRGALSVRGRALLAHLLRTIHWNS